jgi:hypothetical protein
VQFTGRNTFSHYLMALLHPKYSVQIGHLISAGVRALTYAFVLCAYVFSSGKELCSQNHLYNICRFVGGRYLQNNCIEPWTNLVFVVVSKSPCTCQLV